MYRSIPAVATVLTARPSIRDVYEPWAKLSDKYNDLCRRESEITKQLNDLSWERDQHNAVSLCVGAANGQPVANVTYPPKPPKPVPARVRALLAGVIPESQPTPAPAPSSAKPEPIVEYTEWRMQESVDLGKELEDVQSAKELLLPLLETAHLAGSKLLCQARKDDYSAAATKICSALVALGDALNDHLALTQEMSVGGPSYYHLRPIDVNLLLSAIGDPKEPHSKIRRILASAAEGGHFDMKTVPSGWAAPPPSPPAPPEPRRRSLFYLDRAGRIWRRTDGVTVGKAPLLDDAPEASIVSNR
jgi:hypothetical protein